MEVIKIKFYRKGCTGCPTEWDCWTDDNKYIYIRYRWGSLRVGIHESEEDFYKSGNPYNLFDEKIGEDYDGVIEFKDMIEKLKEVLDFSKAKEKYK